MLFSFPAQAQWNSLSLSRNKFKNFPPKFAPVSLYIIASRKISGQPFLATKNP
jgi:hypothetical protein